MKNIVLKNIVDFVTNVDVSVSNDAFIHALMGEISVAESFISALDPCPSNQWIIIKDDMKLDSVTSMLLENFSDAVESEDYMAASIIKKEVLDRMENLDEDYLWNKGRSYIFNLKENSVNSDLCKDWSDTLKEIEHVWNTKKFDGHKYVLDTLIELQEDISGYDRETIHSDIRNFKNVIYTSHPYFSIYDAVNFFKLISK